MPDDQVKPQLLQLLDIARAIQLDFLAGLSDTERAETGTSAHWSAKDEIAHTMMWKRHLADRLTAVVRGEEPPSIPDDQIVAVNERNFVENQARTWDEVMAEDARIHANLLGAVAALAEDDLAEPGRFPWMNGDPLYASVIGNPYVHVQEHLAQYWRDRGEIARAREVNEQFVAALDRPGTLPLARSYGLYNLACFYALTGEGTRAIPLLAEALQLHPKLTEWSKQDPDLASIHQEPAYQAIYAR
jgi:hypothetical protein